MSGRRRKSPPFVMLYKIWLNSDAWAALSGNERALFVELLSHYNGDNNGQIVFSEQQAASSIGVTRTTARKCLRRLQELGWIRPSRKSTFAQKGIATTWRVTVWPAYGKASTLEFLRWKPEPG